jgi:two-component system NtrC family sensor kinase
VSDNRTIEISIKDSGSGIPEAVQRRIFDPFFTTKGPGRGTGLGLSISYGIIEKMGGTLTFTSGENEGTTFVIRLPIRLPEKK